MKFNSTLVIALLISGLIHAQADTPEAVVKNLYEAHNTQNSPFFQTTARKLVEKYFVEDLAAMIWKDAVDSDGEVGAINFDPLYNAQDSEITGFEIEPAREAGGEDAAFVKASFKNFGSPAWVDYELRREAGGEWKIAGMHYSDGEDLGAILLHSQSGDVR